MESFSEVLENVKKYCQSDENVSEIGFNKWIRPLNAYNFENKTAYLTAPNDFSRQTIMDFYFDVIKKGFCETLGFDVDVKIILDPNQSKEKNSDEVEAIKFNQVIENEKKLERVMENGKYALTFDNFIKGKSNELAYAFCYAVAGKNDADSINNADIFNPLFIYGDSGLGKTHLLKAIEHKVRANHPELNIIYVTGEAFTNELVKSILDKNTAPFQEKYRSCDFLLLDDVQFIAGKESTQEEFFHTFNELYNNGKQIVLTSDISPSKMQKLDDRIKSRFVKGVQADIQPPDFETRLAIVKRKAELLDINMSDSVAKLIAEKIKNNIRSLEGVVNKIKALTMFTNEPVSYSMAQRIIRENAVISTPADITVDKIMNDVAVAFNVTPEEIRSPNRCAPISLARKVFIYVIREIKGLSYAQIGGELNRNHATITLNYQDVKKMLEKNSDFKETVNDIIKNLKEG